jgi:vancomycin resistance protein YoaR
MTTETETMPESTDARRVPAAVKILGGSLFVMLLVVGSFELVYAGKVYPGVTADGVYVGGKSMGDASTQIASGMTAFISTILPVTYNKTTLSIPVNKLKLTYDVPKVASASYSYGRTGNLWQRANEQLRAFVGRPTMYADYSYDDTVLTSYLMQASNEIATPAVDASFTIINGQPAVSPAVAGQRLDIGMLILTIEDRLGSTSNESIDAPTYALSAAVSTASLSAAAPEAKSDLTTPLQLTYGPTTQTVDQATIAKWLKIAAPPQRNFFESNDLHDLYPATAVAANLSVDSDAITTYINNLSSSVTKQATNAQLAMVNGVLTVTAPSQDGIALDTTGAVSAITDALKQVSGDRHITIAAKTTQAAVREDNLASLGITDQISEGETYFPGSPAGRLQNVRTGAHVFNGVLLAPGEQFSFGKLLGEVDASTGYVPELVILADHEEDQYGGGLCQVSSTAFRAALAAGLPIDERVNHAFAISYYTWPYSVPGIDATIYYPAVDFKFTNDTGHYILIQTTMKGYDLKFDYYGTKTKSGVIRGPVFVSGSNDATKPSQTVFYRDTLDLAGNVTKTDTFNTYYKSSLLYPVQLNGSK